MQQREVPIPGAREVVATLDEPERGAGSPDRGADAVVVACPPHPQAGGSRTDRRLVAVAERLGEAGIACLRFDYGPWDEGRGEVEDARNALRWAADRFDRIGIFGFSFGGGVAALAAATADRPLGGVSLLAPGSRLSGDPDLDAAVALERVDAPVQVVYGSRDTTADWEPLVERARALGCEVVELGADHFFVGQDGTVAEHVAGFLVAVLRA
jgi:alpha/beta superfamily hydrolase